MSTEQKLESLLRAGQGCIIECLNAELNKTHPVQSYVNYYQQLLASFNEVLEEPTDE